MTQSDKARAFLDLHHGGRVLVLPNAWDVASAVVFEQSGFPAIATTSAGVAAVFGYPDGQQIGRELMLDMIARIAHAVNVPVTADVEGGYGDPVQTAIDVQEAGAVGLNLEDSAADNPSKLADLDKQVKLISTIRARTNLVINARTDVYLAGIGAAETRFDATVERLKAFLAAGADSLFVPGVKDSETIGRLTRALPGPVNILAVAGTPPLADLQRLGVARVSVGSGPMRATLGLARRMATELAERGTFDLMTTGALTYAEVQSMLSGRGRPPL